MLISEMTNAEAKRPLQGDGIRPIEGVPYNIIKPFSKCDTLGSVRSGEGSGARSASQDCFVSGRLPEVRSDGAESRRTPEGFTSLERQRMIGGGTRTLPDSFPVAAFKN
jgi:hypothetical protein